MVTWKKFGSKHVVVLYGASGETHETAFEGTGSAKVQAIGDVDIKSLTKDGVTIINYVTKGKSTVQIGDDLIVYIVDRNEVRFLTLQTTTSCML